MSRYINKHLAPLKHKCVQVTTFDLYFCSNGHLRLIKGIDITTETQIQHPTKERIFSSPDTSFPGLDISSYYLQFIFIKTRTTEYPPPIDISKHTHPGSSPPRTSLISGSRLLLLVLLLLLPQSLVR